ncbi:hypothetical protein WICPIJ_000560 [Wickerhamomyces pijperi]|uniref:Major facilitator superfamily (MFS) profile domain-containing protein n=1 Tax=Wickerhamomyces pijperi TaxID=599730 RepID=A0A9P8QDG4_WICPI|nr:hypothetical protein WICPIJ_000560 [Wickerhamomyces pijperi]
MNRSMNTSTQYLDTSKTIVDENATESYFELQNRSNTSNNNEEDITSKVPTKKSVREIINEQENELIFENSRNSAETVLDEEAAMQTNSEKKETMLAEEDLDFPEGGLKAYGVVLGSFFGLTSAYGLLNISGVIQTYISENQLSGVKESTISWIFSINMFITFITCVFSGTYFDRNGATKPIVLGGLLTVAGLFATANCTKVWHFILGFSIVTGLGLGLAASPLIGAISHYFNKRRGLMNSLSSTGGSIGGIAFPFMLRKLYAEVGFEWAMRIFAFVHLACYCVAVALVHERLPHVTNKGTWVNRARTYMTCIDFKGLRDKKFFFCVLGCVFAECSALSVATYFASYSRAHGFSLSGAYLLISLGHVGGIPGRWITGYYSDIIGRFNVMILTAFVYGIFSMVILLPFADKHRFVLYIYTVFWGFSTGSVFSLLAVCCGQVSRTEEFGRRYGTMYCIVACGTLVWIPICGAIIGEQSLTDYRNYIIFSSLTSVASGICYMISKFFCVGAHPLTKF